MVTIVLTKAFRIFVIGICIALAGGCASLRHKEKTDDFFYRAGDIIKKRCEYWKTFEIQLSVKAKSYGTSNRYLLSCYRNHDLIRLDLTSLWGNTISVVIIRPDESIMWIPAQKTVYKSSNSDGFLKKIAGIDGQITDVLTLITGCFSKSSDNYTTILSDSTSPLIISGLKIKQKDFSWEVVYSPYFSLSPVESAPKNIKILMPHSEINLEVLRIETPATIPQNIFSISYPAGTSVVEL